MSDSSSEEDCDVDVEGEAASTKDCDKQGEAKDNEASNSASTEITSDDIQVKLFNLIIWQ